ncbi:hypothetical protein [Streptomyces endocoffeicus]|uniref:hypothetical protein n=1 Tax=Streptomyces endocoffeicus TaxID=2898945 RepID=UPI001E3602DB|nr:hypothetical protein [Streptomyces endocoffeicus]
MRFAALTAFLPLIIAGFATRYHTHLSLVQTGLLASVVYVPAVAVALLCGPAVPTAVANGSCTPRPAPCSPLSAP